MKIIAKTKDYYDYLQGIYGVDEKLVYDRRQGLGIGSFPRNGEVYFIFLNGKRYAAVYFNGRFRFDKETIEEAFHAYNQAKGGGASIPAGWGLDLYELLTGRISLGSRDVDFKNAREIRRKVRDLTDRVDYGKVNRALRKPVLVSRKPNPKPEDFTGGHWTYLWEPLTLDELNFGSVMSAHDVYIEISNFLSWLVDNPPIPDKQTDKEKIVSHGFDLKTSFRHKK